MYHITSELCYGNYVRLSVSLVRLPVSLSETLLCILTKRLNISLMAKIENKESFILDF